VVIVAGDSVVWSFQEKGKSRRKWTIEFFYFFLLFFLCSQCSTEVDRKITKEIYPFLFFSFPFLLILISFSFLIAVLIYHSCALFLFI
jgi:hypothetical protein